MKRLINRLICLVRGHRWKFYKATQAVTPFNGWALFKCARCGKTKEEFI